MPSIIDTLLGALRSGDESRQVAALRSLSDGPNTARERVLPVLNILRHTESNLVRNAAAIALADMNAPEAIGVIIELLKRKEIESKGTLLYALDELDALVPISILVDLILSGPYEPREEAVNLIEARRFEYDMDPEQVESKLQPTSLPPDAELREAAQRALEALHKYQHS